MNTFCVFNRNKSCNNCGDCNICDLISSKICDNCGKCLKLDDSDVRAVSIDEIEEEYFSDEDFIDYDTPVEDGEETLQNTETWQLIDDIEGLNEILNDNRLFSDRASEIFPGLISINKNE